MNLQEKIQLIKDADSKAILSGESHNGTPLLKILFDVHQKVFGTTCQNCSGKLPGYIRKVQNINLNNSEIMSKEERKYRMKSGSVIHQKGTSKYYSDMNITDEKAEELLKENLNRSALFAKMPKDALKKLEKERASEEGNEAELAKQKAEEEAKAQEEAEKAAQEAFDTAKEAGELTAEQLETINKDEIKAYADTHKYDYDAKANKDALVAQVAEKKVIKDEEKA